MKETVRQLLLPLLGNQVQVSPGTGDDEGTVRTRLKDHVAIS